MKIFLISAAALSLVGGAAVAQPNGHHDRGHDGQGRNEQAHYNQGRNGQVHYDQGRHNGHQWSRGQRLPASYWTSDHYVDYHASHLRRPAHGHRWVRMDDGRYAEIALATGLIYSISH